MRYVWLSMSSSDLLTLVGILLLTATATVLLLRDLRRCSEHIRLCAQQALEDMQLEDQMYAEKTAPEDTEDEPRRVDLIQVLAHAVSEA
jgi:hypothetical protein